MSSRNSYSATSFRESPVGLWLYSSRVGLKKKKSGRDLAHVSRSQPPAREKEQATIVTCGQSSAGLLTSVALQRSLENRLRQRLAGAGSPVYELTWKHWDMQSGPRICALRALGRRTSGRDCSGWPTATVGDSKSTRNATACRNNPNSRHHPGVTLTDAASLTGWPTATASDGERGGIITARMSGTSLPQVANMTGWPTPKAIRPECDTTYARGNPTLAKAAGWATPKAGDGAKGYRDQEAAMRRIQSSIKRSIDLKDQALVSGAMSSTSDAATEKPGQLNPEFVCWLMGFPAEWISYVDWETRSCRRSRQSS